MANGAYAEAIYERAEAYFTKNEDKIKWLEGFKKKADEQERPINNFEKEGERLAKELKSAIDLDKQLISASTIEELQRINDEAKDLPHYGEDVRKISDSMIQQKRLAEEEDKRLEEEAKEKARIKEEKRQEAARIREEKKEEKRKTEAREISRKYRKHDYTIYKDKGGAWRAEVDGEELPEAYFEKIDMEGFVKNWIEEIIRAEKELARRARNKK
jgi:phage-related minor tail protein